MLSDRGGPLVAFGSDTVLLNVTFESSGPSENATTMYLQLLGEEAKSNHEVHALKKGFCWRNCKGVKTSRQP